MDSSAPGDDTGDTTSGPRASDSPAPQARADETGPTLADKLNQAFASLHPADRGPYSNREVAQWFLDNSAPGEPTISINYIAALRNGERDNPTVRHLRALARFFEVPASYFIEDSPDAASVFADLQMVAAMRDADTREIAARAMELDPSTRAWLRNTVAGLPPRTNPERGHRRRRFEAPSPDAPDEGDDSQ